jgi:hypothetical protein
MSSFKQNQTTFYENMTSPIERIERVFKNDVTSYKRMDYNGISQETRRVFKRDIDFDGKIRFATDTFLHKDGLTQDKNTIYLYTHTVYKYGIYIQLKVWFKLNTFFIYNSNILSILDLYTTHANLYDFSLQYHMNNENGTNEMIYEITASTQQQDEPTDQKTEIMDILNTHRIQFYSSYLD